MMKCRSWLDTKSVEVEVCHLCHFRFDWIEVADVASAASKWSLSTGPSGCTLRLALDVFGLQGSSRRVLVRQCLRYLICIDMQMWNTIGLHDGRDSRIMEKPLPPSTPFTSIHLF